MLSFLIVNRNGGEVFKKEIESIHTNIKDANIKNYEIVVIDNASSEDLSWLTKNPHIVLKRNKTNQLFSVPTNDSVKYSKGSLLLILNNDVILQKGCLKELLLEINKPNVDAVVPQLLNKNGTIQLSIPNIPSWKDLLYSILLLHILFPKGDKWRNTNFDYSSKQIVTGQPMFSAVLLKRQVWNKIGPLDHQMPLLYNDVDWFYRFHLNKNKCIYVPKAKAIHQHGMSVNKNMWKKLYLLSTGSYTFFTKHTKDKSAFFNYFIALMCSIAFIERIPLEIFRIIKSNK